MGQATGVGTLQQDATPFADRRHAIVHSLPSPAETLLLICAVNSTPLT